MADEGAIDYMDIPYGNVNWESDNFSMSLSNDLRYKQALSAPAWLYWRDMNNPSETKFVYDTQDMAESEDKRYIILGKSKYRDDVQRRCYVLLVSSAARKGIAVLEWLTCHRAIFCFLKPQFR
jgi:hypothetical protein